MADTDYKIAGSKMYIYPNTETEQQLMNGLIAPTEGYITYITVQNYYKTVEAQTSYENRLAQYDYYLQCVRVPEWASDAPTPPQPTYKSITVNDSYSLEYVLVYENQSVELDPSAVEVGKSVVFSTNNPSYTQTFPEGLEVKEYGTLPSGAVGYKFTMPDYDVEITITEVQPQPTDYDITLVNEDSITVELWDENWNRLSWTDITAGTNLRLLVKDNGYEAVSSDVNLGTPVWESGYNQWQYQFTMPSNDLTVSIVEIPTATLTVVNQDSRRINWYDGTNWYNDTHTAHVGDNIDFICWETSDKITFGSPIEYTEEFDSEGRYQYHFVLNGDLTVTTAARTEAGIYYDGNTDIEILLGETPTYPTLENPNSVTPITYTSSNTDLATVDSSGNVTLISNATGETYITATFEGDSTYDFTGTHFKLKVKEGYDVHFLPDVPTTPDMRFYNVTKQEYLERYGNAVRPSDEIFVTDASYNQKVMYKDSSNTWTTIQFTDFDPITIDGEEVVGGKFTMPSSGVADGDYILVMDNSSNLYDISKNFEGQLYNETLAWWYDEEDQNNPGTYITKYPEGFNLGIESRQGQTYTINPTQTQEQGGSVGMYIVMPSEAIEITKTN